MYELRLSPYRPFVYKGGSSCIHASANKIVQLRFTTNDSSIVGLQLSFLPCFLDHMRNAIAKNDLSTRHVFGDESKLRSTIRARAKLPNGGLEHI